MNYLDNILEDADALLESSKNNGKNNKPNRPGFLEKFKNGTAGIYKPIFNANAIKLTNDNVLRPYGLKEIDITNKRQVTVLIASIKRRRDIQAAKALYLGVIGVGVSAATNFVSDKSMDIANNESIVGKDTVTSDVFSGIGTIFNVIAITSLALTAFIEIVNAIDVVKATKEIREVRNNIMDAYDKVSYMIQHGRPAGGDSRAYDSYHELLSFRDSLREAQMTLNNLGGFGAGIYSTKLDPKQSHVSDLDKREMSTMGYVFYDKKNNNGNNQHKPNPAGSN